MKTLLTLLAAAGLVAGAAMAQQNKPPTISAVMHPVTVQMPSSGADSAPQIRTEAIRAHLEFLANDLLEGRGPGTRGHKLAVNYLRAQCMAAGLVGGAGDGGCFQSVPLIRTRVDEKSTTLAIEADSHRQNLVYGTDYVLLDTHRGTEGRAAAEVVFAGFGVTAPEFGYDDYAGLDVRGKMVALLEFEAPPSFPATVRAWCCDHNVKRANAAAHGAIGVLYIRSVAEEQAFPWSSLLREVEIGWNSMCWLSPEGQPGGLGDSLKVFACLNRSGAEALFLNERTSLSEVLAAAGKGTTMHFALSKRVAIEFHSHQEKIESDNVVAVLEGADPLLRREYVVFSTHVDHLGIGVPVEGDAIYNGAIDNAGGCAVLLEVARAFAQSPVRPARSLIFLFVTAEEAGLLGSDYFAHYPTVAREQIVANINFDGGTAPVSVRDLVAYGIEHSSLRDAVERTAPAAGFGLGVDPFPQEGFFVRSDQYSFVKQGIPAVMIDLGFKSDEPDFDLSAFWKRWLVTIYHSPKDESSQRIHYETSARFAHFIQQLGLAVANDPIRAHWNDGDFFGRRYGAGIASISPAVPTQPSHTP